MKQDHMLLLVLLLFLVVVVVVVAVLPSSNWVFPRRTGTLSWSITID